VTLLPVGIFGYAIGVALLPLLSRQIQSGQEDAACASQNRAIEMSLLLTIPASVGLGLLAEPITSTLFEGGQFTVADRTAVAQALFAFSFGLPAYVLNKGLTPGFFSRHDTRTTVIVSAIALVVNIGLNLALMIPLGHVGIAIGSSVSAWINAGLLAVILHRRGHFVVDDRLRRRLPLMVLSSALMGVGLWFGRDAVAQIFGPVFGSPGVPAGPFLLRALALSLLIGGGVVIFVAAVFLTGTAETSDLALLRRRRRA
jgi:putative peptidoglycan lipid II flippase